MNRGTLIIVAAALALLGRYNRIGANIDQPAPLFYALANAAKNRASFEPCHEGGGDSRVIEINSVDQFNRKVLKESCSRPVVVKIYTTHNPDSQRVQPHFQEVAEAFGEQVTCAALDSIKQHEVVMQLQQQYKLDLTQLSLPLFLFYKEGGLYAPDHLPATMVQGYHTRENLIELIQRKFGVTPRQNGAQGPLNFNRNVRGMVEGIDLEE